MKEGKSEVMCAQGQLYKMSKGKDGIVTRLKLTKHWTDWVDYWAVDFDYFQHKEIIKVPAGTGAGGIVSLPGLEQPQGEPAMPDFEERWTGGYFFENEWQSFRTRQCRDLELTTAEHIYQPRGRYTVGNDPMTSVPVNSGNPKSGKTRTITGCELSESPPSWSGVTPTIDPIALARMVGSSPTAMLSRQVVASTIVTS